MKQILPMPSGKVLKKLIPQVWRKRKYDMSNIFNGMFYILKSGCYWCMLPRDFPKWQIVYYHSKMAG